MVPSLPARSPSDPTDDESNAIISGRAGGELTTDLIRAARTGDPAAVTGLLSQIRPALVRYCRARITPRSGHGNADDLAQDICITLLHALPTFTGEPNEILRWVYGIAAHKVLDHQRHTGSNPSEHPPSRVDPRADPEEPTLRGAHHTPMRALLALLTPAQQEILALRLIVGLSSADTAAVTAMSPTAVRVTQHQALNLLRDHLQSTGTAGPRIQQMAATVEQLHPHPDNGGHT
jgi:RNA polymerase sigma-70 factor (ECF subfamily)